MQGSVGSGSVQQLASKSVAHADVSSWDHVLQPAEVRCKDGGEYEGKTLYDIVICLQFHFEKSGLFWKLIDDAEFQSLKWTLDNLMKSRCSSRLGSLGSAKPISFEEET